MVRFLARLMQAIVLLTIVFPGKMAYAAIAMESRFFTTSDGVHLHYLEAGNRNQKTILFIPGWTMPA